MAKFLLLQCLLILTITYHVTCDSEEITMDGTDQQVESLVIDPEVAEEIRQEKKHDREEHEKELEKELKGETKPLNPDDEIQPKVDILYKPKNCKRKSANRDLMVVHYTGWLAKSGRKFDSTIDVRRRYAPFEFVLGTAYVIKGWDIGLLDMCPGEKRKLTVPPQIGYGKKGLRGIIPPNATLVFLIDLLDLRRATPSYTPMDLFSSLDRDNDKVLSREEISHYVKYQSRIYGNKNAKKPTPEEHDKMISEIMEKEDRNGDGIIQHSEFSGPKLQHHVDEL